MMHSGQILVSSYVFLYFNEDNDNTEKSWDIIIINMSGNASPTQVMDID